MDKTLAKAAEEFAVHAADTKAANDVYIEARTAFEGLENERREKARAMMELIPDGEQEVYIAVDAATVVRVNRNGMVSVHPLITL